MKNQRGVDRPDEVERETYERPGIRTLKSSEIVDALGPAMALYGPETGGTGGDDGGVIAP